MPAQYGWKGTGITQLSIPASLADVTLGESVDIVGYGDGAPIQRFAQMGFIPGRTVRAVRTAPMGDPIEYSVMGSRVAMRRSDASSILVSPHAS